MSGPELIIDLISSSSEGEEDSEVKFMGQVASSSQDKVRERESKDEKQNRKRRRTEPTPLRSVIDEIGQRDNAIITEIIESISSYCVKTPSKAGRLSLTCIGSSPKCRSTVEHIQQRDMWSCGFRNTQMMLTAILPHLEHNHTYYQMVPRRTDHVSIPNIRQIQNALEQAWRKGFDPNGARHYNHKIVGKSSKIGAVEVSSVLTYWGLDSSVIQFVRCKESREMLPKFVRAYFSKALGKEGCPFCQGKLTKSDAIAKQLLEFATISLNIEESCTCPLLPLYCQWEGHSVTIVGIDADGTFLILDPLKSGTKIKSDIASRKRVSAFHLSPKEIQKRDTQIIMCSLCSLSLDDKQSRRKDLRVMTAAKESVLRAISRSN